MLFTYLNYGWDKSKELLCATSNISYSIFYYIIHFFISIHFLMKMIFFLKTNPFADMEVDVHLIRQDSMGNFET